MLPSILLLLLVAVARAGPLAANRLQIEYLPSPVLGIDIPSPRFSWQIAHTDRAQSQSAYSITVYTTPKNIVWATGKVNSAQAAQIEYAGLELQSDTSYYWQVQWWDNIGRMSPTSAAANFDTGFLHPNLWAAAWIGGANQLRREFTLPTLAVTRARLFISGVGYYVARINGNRVGDHVLGPWTQFESRVYYDVYDIGGFLTQGDNAIAVALGNGFYSHPSVAMGPPALIAQISVTFSDGSHQWAALTDTTWNIINGSVVSDDVYVGEVIDARLATPGWDKPGFDDSMWLPATAPTPTPPGILQAHLQHAQKIMNTFTPLNMWECAHGVYVFDFGQNVAGWSQIRAIGPSGTTISVQHSEMVDPTTNCLRSMYSNAPMIDNYTLAGTGDWEYFEPEFVYHGFQYVQVSGYPGVPSAEVLQSFFIHSSLPETGSFITSDPVLNYVDHMTRASAIANFQSIPTDCPTREKRGWLGDSQVSAETQMHYWDMSAAYTKFVQDIHDSQTKIGTGQLGDTAPWYQWGATPADPGWGTAFALLWYWQYVYYNDTRMLTTHYDGVKWYINNLTSMVDNTTHLLAWSRYGDWLSTIDTPAQVITTPVISSFYYIVQLELLAEVATILGKTNDTETYSKLATNARAAFNPAYYNANNYTYGIGVQTNQVLPLVANLVSDGEYNNVVNYLLNDILNTNKGHLTVGVVGAKYLLPTLSAIGRSDVAWTVATQTDFPSWYNFAANGGTTLWESWFNTRTEVYGSRNHIMFGGQAAWYYQGLAGITMTPGTLAYSDITIDPVLLDGPNLTFVSASINTLRGFIESSWSLPTPMCATANEGNSATLSCPFGGVITDITFASFGTPTGACGSYQYDAACNANTSMAVVSKLCIGSSSCNVAASRSNFLYDPCPDISKFLFIQYSGCYSQAYELEVTIPANSVANVVVSKMALSNPQILESGQTVWQRNQYQPGVYGIVNATDRGDAIVFRVGSGSYDFTLFGGLGQVMCASAADGDAFKATCPDGYLISKIRTAHFGPEAPVGTCGKWDISGQCSLGSSKHVVERQCLHKQQCAFAVSASLFGDKTYKLCGKRTSYALHAEYVCSQP